MKKKGEVNRHPVKKFPIVAACGLDCGLCPRFYTEGPSRCPGCAGPGFFTKHPTCSFITCCVRQKGFEVCAECSEFPCPKFKTGAEYSRMNESSSYPSCRKILPNLFFIKRHGIAQFIRRQRARMRMLKVMIAEYNDGRSRSFFCRAAVFLESASLHASMLKAGKLIQERGIRKNDMKSRATILRSVLLPLLPSED